ncbi:hypothetical protein [Streptomyces sp. NPDC059455]|uniref:hypothetical protein n=1 Tax=Streptomyces sp. NPDC059455 TaxID=3346837 RepID=UPI0036870CC6
MPHTQPLPRTGVRFVGLSTRACRAQRYRRAPMAHAAVYFRFDDKGLITRIEEYANFIPAGRDS